MPAPQAFRYALVSVGNLILLTLGVYLLTEQIHLPYWGSKLAVSLFLGIFYNFPLQKYFVFKTIPLIRTAVPGPKSQEWRKREDRFLAPGLQNFALMAGIVVKNAKGSVVTDLDGNKFIDIIGGIGVNGLGHSHPKYIRALKKQVKRASVGSFTSQPRVELMEEIASLSPSQKLNRIQLYSSGAEAVESALRLAKSYTKKTNFVSFWGGFHGKTMGVLSLMGSDFKEGLGPMVPGSHIVPYANCYRCPVTLKYPSCKLACVDLAREQLKKENAKDIAAFIVEPLQGTAGNIVPPKEFLPAIKKMAQDMGALLIADEMITGFGRTGKMWGVEHSAVEPDIITLGKQFGGGFPVSAILSTTEITKAKPWANPSGSSSSYGGNPLASAAAKASLKIIKEENLVENSKKMGEFLLSELKLFVDRYPFVGQVQGEGLFIGMELVKDREQKTPLSKDVCKSIFQKCLEKGLLTMSYAPHFRMQPSMNLQYQTALKTIEILKDVFSDIEREGAWRA